MRFLRVQKILLRELGLVLSLLQLAKCGPGLLLSPLKYGIPGGLLRLSAASSNAQARYAAKYLLLIPMAVLFLKVITVRLFHHKKSSRTRIAGAILTGAGNHAVADTMKSWIRG